MLFRGDVKIPTYKPHTNHKKPSVRSHTLAPTTICDLSHNACRSPLTDLGHINSVTYGCHPLWFVCGHRKGILMSPLKYSKHPLPVARCSLSGFMWTCTMTMGTMHTDMSTMNTDMSVQCLGSIMPGMHKNVDMSRHV